MIMLAVVEIGGNQFIVKQGDIIEVKKVDLKDGETLSIEPLLVSDEEGENVQVGTPSVSGAKVDLKVLEQFKDEKVRVFKMKSKKRYSRNKGFRASLTKLEVLKIA